MKSKAKQSREHQFKEDQSSRVAENIAATVIVLAIVILVLVNIDSEWLKQWIHAPLIWRDPSYIEITLVDKQENYNDRTKEGLITLVFDLRNTSDYDIDSCTFYYYLDGYENTGFVRNLDSQSEIEYNAQWTLYMSQGRRLFGRRLEDIDFRYHIKRVEIGTKKVLNQNSTWKIVLILIISLISVFLVWQDKIENPLIRVVLKVLMVPAIAVLIGLASAPNSAVNHNAQRERNTSKSQNSEHLSRMSPNTDSSSEIISSGQQKPIQNNRNEPQLYKNFIIRYSVGSGGEVFTERVNAIEGGMVRKMIQAKYPGQHINVFLCIPERMYNSRGEL